MEDSKNSKTGCILFDKKDFDDFNGIYKPELPDDICWFPVEYYAIAQLIFGNNSKRYFLPRVELAKSCSDNTKAIYEESQRFIKKLFAQNEFILGYLHNQIYPLEYFWLCLFMGVYRIVSFCQDLLEQCPLDQIFLIERDKIWNNGGLLLNSLSFTNVIKDVFQKKGVKVKTLSREASDQTFSSAPFYWEKGNNWKHKVKKFLHFIYWKFISIGRKNYKYLIIIPGYENRINYTPRYTYRQATSPQIYQGRSIPFFHHFTNMAQFYAKWKKIQNSSCLENDTAKCKTVRHLFQVRDYICDIGDAFALSVDQYFKDIVWMKKYIDLWWACCPKKEEIKAIIFTNSPVHLDSYFLMKKARENKGKVVYRQHGGIFGYSDHFIYYVQNYKLNDIFLTFGEIDTSKLAKDYGAINTKCIEIGSHLVTSPNKITKRRYKWRGNDKLDGIFVPSVIVGAVEYNRIKWNGPMQISNTKKIIDLFETENFGKLTIKGLKNNQYHLNLKRYIQINKNKNVNYIDCTLRKALISNPSFVIVEDVSSPLIEVLGAYNGLVFVLNGQESFKMKPEANSLLKRRVIYSESFDELEFQVKKYIFNTGKNQVFEDSTFMDKYVKPFEYEKYRQFLFFLGTK